MAQNSQEIIVQAGVPQMTGQSCLPGLEGYAAEPVPGRGGLRYSDAEVVNALIISRGSYSGAARILSRLSPVGQCSPTTVRERAKDPAIARAVADLGLQLLESARDILLYAADDRCWQCGGLGRVPVEPRFVGDPEEAGCGVCRGTGCCRQKIDLDQDGREIVVADHCDIDPVEQRQWARWVWEKFSEQADQTVKVPANWLEGKTAAELRWAREELRNKRPLKEVYQILASSSGVPLSESRRLTGAPDEAMPEAGEDE